ncbi:MAG: hypothetical protein ChlgKO_14910 [Chlamydiales bacterium]
MIGIGLLALCLTALTMRPVLCARKTFKALEEIEFERIAEVSFAEIQENYLENHPFGEIAWTKVEAEFFPMEEFAFSIIPGKKRSVKRSYRIWKRKKNFGADGHNAKLVRCEIYLGEKKEHKYQNHLFLEEIPK